MKVEKAIKILSEDIDIYAQTKDPILSGLKIVAKYTPERVVIAAAKDMIYSQTVPILVEKGITEKEVYRLRELGWMHTPHGNLAHFV